MYIELDRVDIELAPHDGHARVIQTDHRTSTEIAERPALSTIIAVIRCLNPRRACPEVALFYHCQHEPPAFFGEVIAACGARVSVGDATSYLEIVGPVDERRVNELVNSAMQELARDLIAASCAADALAALELREAEMTCSGFPEEEDVSPFWIAVLELGVLAGAAIGATNGGVWFHDADGPGTLPLKYRCSFEGDTATANPLGKALKFLREKGGGDEPSGLVRMLRSRP